jgi:hypothetical protein
MSGRMQMRHLKLNIVGINLDFCRPLTLIFNKFRYCLGYLLYHCATEPEKWECNKCKLTVPNTMVESLLSILKSVVILFHVYTIGYIIPAKSTHISIVKYMFIF